MFLDDAPVHKFYDKIRAEESRRCVLDSASAGLYHLGMNSLAYRIHSTIGDKRKELAGFEYFRTVVQNKATRQERKQMYLCKIKPQKFNVLTDSQNYLLWLIGLHSSDGKTDHAICIVGKWIFDSNFEKALPLNDESLQICSSSKERKTSFIGITRGYGLKARKK